MKTRELNGEEAEGERTLETEVKMTVEHDMLMPIAKVSVAKRILTKPS